jgi:ABC-type glycerol-3-phosphate transport system substrate-binding protein
MKLTGKDAGLLITAVVVFIAAVFIVVFTRTDSVQEEEVQEEVHIPPLTILFSQWFGAETAMQASLEASIAEFKREYPHIQVILDTRSRSDISQALNIAPGALGELVSLESDWPATSLGNRIELASFPYLLFYNIDILSAAGFDRPPQSRQDLISMAATVSGADSGVRGFEMALADASGLYREVYTWFWAAGVPLFNDKTGANPGFYINRQTGRTILDFFSELVSRGLLTADAYQRSGQEKLAGFLAGETAIIVAASSALAEADAAGINYGIAPIPGPLELEGKPLLGEVSWEVGLNNAALALTTDSHREAATLFLDWLNDNRERLQAPIPSNSMQQKVEDIRAAGMPVGEFQYYDETVLAALEVPFKEEFLKLINGEQNTLAMARALQNRWNELN